MKAPIRVAVTGAAGNIGYALLWRIASGDCFGHDQPIILQLLEIPPGMDRLKGVMMELTDSAFDLVHGMIGTSDANEAFKDADAIFLVGSRPRSAGMDRADLVAHVVGEAVVHPQAEVQGLLRLVHATGPQGQLHTPAQGGSQVGLQGGELGAGGVDALDLQVPARPVPHGGAGGQEHDPGDQGEGGVALALGHGQGLGEGDEGLAVAALLAVDQGQVQAGQVRLGGSPGAVVQADGLGIAALRLLEVAHAWVQQVHARRPRRPVLLGRLARWDRLEPRARAFLDADPSYREAVPVHRWSMDGRTEVSAGSFGPLVVMEARQSCGDTVTEDILDKLCARAEAWGWRYFDAFPRIPVDIDTSGVALQVLAAAQRQDSTAAREARDAILAEPTPDGLLTTWRHHPRTEQPWRWERARCPVATANALAGLAAVNTWSPRMELAADALLAWAIDPDPSESAHYAQDVARGWVLLQLHRIGRGKAATPLAHELLAAFDLRGRVGSVLATAAAVRGLRAVGLGDRLPPAALVGLGEALSADGGVRADPFFRTIRPGQGQEPGRGAAWVSSRIVGTAWVRAALVGTASLHRGCRRVVGFFGA